MDWDGRLVCVLKHSTLKVHVSPGRERRSGASASSAYISGSHRVAMKEPSAVRSSAYISGDRLFRDETGEVIYYGDKKADRVVDTGVMLPDGAPDKYFDSDVLWNAVEKREMDRCERYLESLKDDEKRAEGTTCILAHKYILAIPEELDPDLRREAVLEFCHEMTSRGAAVEWAIHDESKPGNANHHAHVMATARPLDRDGFERKKSLNEYLCRRGDQEAWMTPEEFAREKKRGWEKVFRYRWPEANGLVGEKRLTKSQADALGLASTKSQAKRMGKAEPDRVGSQPVRYKRELTSAPRDPQVHERDDWGERANLKTLRKSWETAVNRALVKQAERDGRDEPQRVDLQGTNDKVARTEQREDSARYDLRQAEREADRSSERAAESRERAAEAERRLRDAEDRALAAVDALAERREAREAEARAQLAKAQEKAERSSRKAQRSRARVEELRRRVEEAGERLEKAVKERLEAIRSLLERAKPMLVEAVAKARKSRERTEKSAARASSARGRLEAAKRALTDAKEARDAARRQSAAEREPMPATGQRPAEIVTERSPRDVQLDYAWGVDDPRGEKSPQELLVRIDRQPDGSWLAASLRRQDSKDPDLVLVGEVYADDQPRLDDALLPRGAAAALCDAAGASLEPDHDGRGAWLAVSAPLMARGSGLVPRLDLAQPTRLVVETAEAVMEQQRAVTDAARSYWDSDEGRALLRDDTDR